MILCLIPARKGSKRLPGKNTKLFNGRPLIEYTIDQAKECEFIDKIVLSTDIEELLRKYPDITERRPAAYCTDSAPIQAEIDRIWMKYKPEMLILLQCTFPQRRVGDIFACFRLFSDNPQYSSLMTVNQYTLKPMSSVVITRTSQIYDPPLQIAQLVPIVDIDDIYDFRIAEALMR